jgi:hypothetical protein
VPQRGGAFQKLQINSTWAANPHDVWQLPWHAKHSKLADGMTQAAPLPATVDVYCL